MRFSVQYIPLSRIKPDRAARKTQRIKKLRLLMWDCMNLVAVRKDKRRGHYIAVSGSDRLEYLRHHSTKKLVPCLIDEHPVKAGIRGIGGRRRLNRWLQEYPSLEWDGMLPASLSIPRAFVRREPRFRQLTRPQQARLLLMALRYKHTAVKAMQRELGEMTGRR